MTALFGKARKLRLPPRRRGMSADTSKQSGNLLEPTALAVRYRNHSCGLPTSSIETQRVIRPVGRMPRFPRSSTGSETVLTTRNQRQIQSLVIGQNNLSGAPVEVSSAVAVSLASGSTGKLYKVFNVSVPYSTSVLDTSAATQLSGAAAIRMAAGQTIAFEATNSINLTYTSASGAIVAKYGATTCAIGRGISVSFGIVFMTSATIPATSSGSIVFLVGSGSYTITLPAADTVMAGTGFTFSAIGSGTATIVPASGDTIELAPITLHQYDRYHIISDGSSLWRETFRTNSVSPRFAGPPVLPSLAVSGLPASSTPGAQAFATNGRKPNEVVGAGTGVQVFYDGMQWISVCSGTPVLS